MKFLTVADLWDANARSPWTPNEVYEGFTQSENYDTNKLQRMLGIQSEFTQVGIN